MTLMRKLSLTGLITSVVVLAGCATNVQQKADAFEQQSKRLGVIYAQVNKVTRCQLLMETTQQTPSNRLELA